MKENKKLKSKKLTRKLLKIFVGCVYINGKSHNVYKTAWFNEELKAYVIRDTAFENEIELEDKE